MVYKFDFNVMEHDLQTQLLNLRIHLQNLEADVIRVKNQIEQVIGAQEILQHVKVEQFKIDAENDLHLKSCEEQVSQLISGIDLINSEKDSGEDHALSAQPI